MRACGQVLFRRWAVFVQTDPSAQNNFAATSLKFMLLFRLRLYTLVLTLVSSYRPYPLMCRDGVFVDCIYGSRVPGICEVDWLVFGCSKIFYGLRVGGISQRKNMLFLQQQNPEYAQYIIKVQFAALGVTVDSAGMAYAGTSCFNSEENRKCFTAGRSNRLYWSLLIDTVSRDSTASPVLHWAMVL